MYKETAGAAGSTNRATNKCANSQMHARQEMATHVKLCTGHGSQSQHDTGLGLVQPHACIRERSNTPAAQEHMANGPEDQAGSHAQLASKHWLWLEATQHLGC